MSVAPRLSLAGRQATVNDLVRTSVLGYTGYLRLIIVHVVLLTLGMGMGMWYVAYGRLGA